LIGHSHGFAEKPVFKPMFGWRIRAADGWRGLRFAKFGAAPNRSDEKKCEASITPLAGPCQPAFPANPCP
jgi:hypothetical protein